MLGNAIEPKIDKRAKKTRKLLQQTFADLMEEKDYQSITVADIVARADVNRTTFYLHFEDKNALLSYSVRSSLQEQLDKHLTDVHRLTHNNLRLLSVVVNRFMSQFFKHCHPGTRTDENLIIGAQVHEHVYELLLLWMKNAENGDAARPISPELAAKVLSWVIFGSAFQSAVENRNESPERLADQIMAFLAPSLQAYSADLARG